MATSLTSSSILNLNQLSQLEEINNNNKIKEYFVGVDVGGTNLRTSLFFSFENGSQSEEPFFVSSLKANDTRTLLKALQQVNEEVFGVIGKVASASCIAVAGRLLDNNTRVSITNYDLLESGNGRDLSLNELPKELFPIGKSFFLNDLESACYGVIALSATNKIQSYFNPLWNNESNSSLTADNYLVLAMGTGLGVALLNKPRGSSKFNVLPMEFGHIQLSSLSQLNPRNAEEQRMITFISNKLYNGKHNIEIEDICSGRGLGYVYEWLVSENAELTNLPITEVVKNANLKDDSNEAKFASKAFSIHYEWLFRCAQTLSVGLQAKGFFLAGDNQVTNSNFVQINSQYFYEIFLDHPKKDWINNVTCFQQTKQLNINIIGALYFAKTSQ
eukprot:TRINITY_DN661_c1_g2_i1.p1 TRINITY_DN661_c1_g2~~TRINITY_DN661_c1_g2_i1.p1  ORF type:complete len:406 (-),score=193.26 TRINITY_DN661_c1_g2_i1:57-1220(-)